MVNGDKASNFWLTNITWKLEPILLVLIFQIVWLVLLFYFWCERDLIPGRRCNLDLSCSYRFIDYDYVKFHGSWCVSVWFRYITCLPRQTYSVVCQFCELRYTIFVISYKMQKSLSEYCFQFRLCILICTDLCAGKGSKEGRV